MRQAFRDLFNHGYCLLAAVPLFAQETRPRATNLEGETSGAFKELIKEWWLWGGIVLVLVLVGVLYYVRNKQEED
jgi:hypothetical protein